MPASDIEPVRTEWLLEGRIPMGKFGLITGDGGVGKNLYATRLIADITTGALPGDLHGVPRTVLIAEAEDTAADVVLPRLLAAGADTDLVFFIEARNGRSFVIPDDVAPLRDMIETHESALGFLSPLSSFTSGKLDDSRERDMRDAVGPLADLAHETGATIAAIRHPNKRSEGSFRSRVTGSHGLHDLARWVLHVSRDPQDPGGDTRVVTVQKANLARGDRADRFRIAEKVVRGVGPVPFVTDVKPADDVSAADVLDAPAPGAGQATKSKRAETMIVTALDDGEWHPASDVVALCKAAGIGRATIERAAKALDDEGRIARRRGTGKAPPQLWRLLSVAEGTSTALRPPRIARKGGSKPPSSKSPQREGTSKPLLRKLRS